jgi:hypothetical protein
VAGSVVLYVTTYILFISFRAEEREIFGIQLTLILILDYIVT